MAFVYSLKVNMISGARYQRVATYSVMNPELSSVDAAERAHVARWLRTLATDVAAATPGPKADAGQALAVVRLLALDIEAAALTRLLPAQ